MRLAFICACESAWVDNAVDFKHSIVGSILEGTHLAYVIGAQTSLDITAAETFLEKTLELIYRLPLDRALAQARTEVRAILSDDGRDKFSALDWWVPVLYARTTNFEIFAQPDELNVPELKDDKQSTASTVMAGSSQRMQIRPMAATVLRALLNNIVGTDGKELDRMSKG